MDPGDLLTHRLYDASTELASHYFIARVIFAPEPTHGCMVSAKSENPFATWIANCSICRCHDLSDRVILQDWILNGY